MKAAMKPDRSCEDHPGHLHEENQVGREGIVHDVNDTFLLIELGCCRCSRVRSEAVPAAAPRRAGPLERRRVGDGLETAAEGAQRRAILEAGPVAEGLRAPDSQTPGPPFGRRARLTS